MNLMQIGQSIRLNLRLQMSEPAVYVLMICLPLIMVPFMQPAAQAQLVAQGYAHATGAEQVVPGITVLFSFLSVQTIIQMFYNENTWNTWARQQVSATTLTELILGKVVVAFLIQLCQLGAVIALSVWLFHFRINGSWLALGVVIASFAATLTFFGVMIVSLTHTEDVALAFSNLLGILMTGLGGSFSLTSTFPHWAQQLARFDPAYWALTAIQKISLDGGGLHDISHHVAIIWLMAALFGLVAIVGFHFKSLKENNH